MWLCLYIPIAKASCNQLVTGFIKSPIPCTCTMCLQSSLWLVAFPPIPCTYLYMILYDLRLVNAVLLLNCCSRCSLADAPYYWDEMADEREYGLYVVLEESPEHQKVAALFRSTLPNSRIVRIERIQNKVLWGNYQQRKKHLEKIVHGRDVEKLLFHGTRSTEPEKIYAGEVGFDMRRSARGMWGEGCYFAVNASYSRNYAHGLPSGMNQMLVARVLTGGATHDDTQRGKVLPARTSSDRAKGQIERQYTCVRAFTGGSEIYVTKENSYAYPEYLITFE